MQVGPLHSSSAANPVAGAASPSSKGNGFADALAERLESINDKQLQADNAVEKLATGEAENIHDVVLSMAEADLTFRLVLEIRNRLIESYQEIMRMQV